MGLSFQCAIALTPLADTLVIVGEFLSCSVAAGFILVLPLHHGDLDSVGVLTKHHVAVLVAWPWLGGAYLWDKNTCARTSTENVGGGLIHEWGIYAGCYGMSIQQMDTKPFPRQHINTATYQGQVDVQQELLLRSGTAPHVPTLCPPNITACNQISWAFFLFFCIPKKTGGWEWPGNEATFERLPYNPKQIARVIAFVSGGIDHKKHSVQSTLPLGGTGGNSLEFRSSEVASGDPRKLVAEWWCCYY